MYKIILFFLISIFISCQQTDTREVIFRGQIENGYSRLNTQRTIYIKDRKTRLTIDSIPIDPDGSFEKKVVFEKFRNLALLYTNRNQGCFPFLTIDGREYNVTISNDTTEVVGNPEYLLESKIYRSLRNREENIKWLKKNDYEPDDFVNYIRGYYKKRKGILEKHKAQINDLDEQYLHRYEKGMDFARVQDLYRYIFNKKVLNSLELTDLLKEELQIAGKITDLNNEVFWKSYIPTYTGMVYSYIDMESVSGEFNINFNAFTDLALKKLDIIDEQIDNQRIKNDIIYGTLSGKISSMGLDQLKKAEYFVDKITDVEKTEKLNKLILRTKKIASGADAPMFELEDVNGNIVSLSDLKGKLVYIDFWATWCGPCKKQIPYLKALEQRYHDKPIEFVSITVDRIKDKDKWYKMVEKEELSGIQLFAGENAGNIKENYLVKGIPHFVLIDKSGKIIKNNCTRPSYDEEITKLIESNL